MRLLPIRADHVGGGAAGRQPQADRCRDRRRHVGQHLPLRHLSADPGGNPAGWNLRVSGQEERRPMSPEPLSSAAAGLSRRTILKAATAGGLLLGFLLRPLRAVAAEAADNAVFAPNAFVRID